MEEPSDLMNNAVKNKHTRRTERNGQLSLDATNDNDMSRISSDHVRK